MEHGCTCTSLGRDSPSHSFTVQMGGKEPLLSVCRGGGRLWSPHPTATSQGRGRRGGKINVRRHRPRRKVSKPRHRLERCFFPLRLWTGRHSRFKWQETQNGRRPADPAGDNHPHPVAMGFCSGEDCPLALTTSSSADLHSTESDRPCTVPSSSTEITFTGTATVFPVRMAVFSISASWKIKHKVHYLTS